MTETTSSSQAGNKCEACGRVLPSNAPAGICPTCLMQHGVGLVKATRARPGGFVAPSIDEISLLFPEFEVLDILGQGGMGAVYKAVQRDLDRPVAIKILPPETAADKEFIERFRREAATLAILDDPNIVRLFNYGQRDPFAFFVMEFVDGIDLSRRILEGPMPSEEVLPIAVQLCTALQHSHDRGIVHRDIKPANILLTRNHLVKVADFGLARLVNPDASQLGLTQTRATLGTPRYMAPEQMTPGAVVDHRADIYALGVVLYEMLTGVVPAGNFAPPSDLVPSLSTRLDDLILQALQREPEDRPASAKEIEEHLERALKDPGPTRQQRRKTLALQALMASLGAAVLGAGAAFLWSSWVNHDPSPIEGTKNTQGASTSPVHAAGRLHFLTSTNLSLQLPPDQTAHVLAVSSSPDEFGVFLIPPGRIMVWGNNRFGQTDPGFEADDIIGIAAGQGPKAAHALALRSDGTVVGWGDNTYGQALPPEGIPAIKAIAAGELHSLALSVQGKVLAWGNPASGATSIPGQILPVLSIAAGANFNVALQTNGQVLAWGDNQFGQCNIPGSLRDAVEIDAGDRHALARLPDGSVLAWGDNSASQCDIPPGLPPAQAVFAGAQASAILDQNGEIHAWGRIPANLPSIDHPVRQLAIGSTSWIALE